MNLVELYNDMYCIKIGDEIIVTNILDSRLYSKMFVSRTYTVKDFNRYKKCSENCNRYTQRCDLNKTVIYVSVPREPGYHYDDEIISSCHFKYKKIMGAGQK